MKRPYPLAFLALPLASFSIALATSNESAGQMSATGNPPPPPGFSTFKIGGGGWLVQVFGTPDGSTKLALPDTASTWVKCSGDNAFRELIKPSNSTPRMEAPGPTYSGAVAPSDPNRIYVQGESGYIYFTTDCGRTIRRFANFRDTTGTTVANSGEVRFHGPKMAVHPTNPNIVYVSGPQKGIWKTTDGSNPNAVWTQVGPSAIPPPIPTTGSFNGVVTSKATNSLTFAGVSGVTPGSFIYNVTNPSTLPLGTAVSSFTGTSINSTTNLSNVNVGDTIRVQPGAGVASSAYYAIAVDTSDNLYVFGNGWKPYKVSTDGTVTQLLSGTAPSSSPYQIALAPDGSTLWAVSDSNLDWTGSNSNVWKYTNGSWSRLTKSQTGSPIGPTALAIDATNPNLVVMATTGHHSLVVSNDGGGTFRRYTFGGLSAKDIPWLGAKVEWWSLGNIWITGDQIIAGQGVGVWSTPKASVANGFIWTSITADIEQLVVHGIAAGGDAGPLFSIADRDVFVNPTPQQYTAIQGGCMAFCGTLGQSWNVDCSPFDANDCAIWSNGVYASKDGGRRWTRDDVSPWHVMLTLAADAKVGDTTLKVRPDNRALSVIAQDGWCYAAQVNACGTPEISGVDIETGTISLLRPNSTARAAGTALAFVNLRFPGGSIAISQPGNVVQVSSYGTTYPYYKKDGTWRPVIICKGGCTGFNANGSAISEPNQGTGWGISYYYWGAKAVAADAVKPGTFYLINNRTAAGGGGCYRNTNGGEGNWERRSNENPPITAPVASGSMLRALPGHADTLLLNSSNVMNGYNPGVLFLSRDACRTWRNVGQFFSEINSYAIGKAAPGSSTPAVYVSGKRGAQTGYWRTNNIIDPLPRWDYLGAIDSFFAQSCGSFTFMGGDMTRYGVFYQGSCGGAGQWTGYFP